MNPQDMDPQAAMADAIVGGAQQTTPGGDSPAPEQPSTDESTKALVAKWTGKVQAAKRFHSKTFKRMRDNAAFTRGKQWPGDKMDGEPAESTKYVANLTLRHVATKVAALYAKNPKAVAYRRKTLEYPTWDGKQESLAQAIQTVSTVSAAAAADPTAVQAMAPQLDEARKLLAEVVQGSEKRKQIDRIAKTLEIVYDYEVKEQIPPFKTQMKQLVRRAVVTGVGYVKLGYHRYREHRPEDIARIQDMTEQLAHAERLAASVQAGDVTAPSADIAELKAALSALQNPGTPMYMCEGLDFDFPPSTSLVIDPACRNLAGFIGAGWIAQEFLLTPDQIKEVYGVDVSGAYTAYTPDASSPGYTQNEACADKPHACVWEIYDKRNRMCFTIVEGYPGYAKPPARPAVDIERFWPFFVLTLNETEDETCIFPPSDVDLIRPMQREHNLSRQRLVEHRDAARPKHVTPAGMLQEKDKTALTESAAHTVVELSGLAPGQKVNDVLQAVPNNPIDPNLYEVSSVFEDSMKVMGAQEANLGGVSGGTATESSIAESSRLSVIGSNADDLDDFLTDLARSASHVLLMNMSADAVRAVAGDGAVWPELQPEQIAKELWLEVKAGSSGRPNKAMEIQNLERLLPFFLQVPGLDPKWLLGHILERYDERIDPADAIAANLPSIIAMNAATPPPGAGAPIPAAQGPAGEAGPSAGPAPVVADTRVAPNTAAETPTGNLPPAPLPAVPLIQ